MKAFLVLAVALVLTASTDDGASARYRHHVVIHKQPPAVDQQPVVRPLMAVPPFAMAIDLVRRTSCDPAIAVATGPDDPGFTSHPVGNYLLPAIYTSRCPAVNPH